MRPYQRKQQRIWFYQYRHFFTARKIWHLPHGDDSWSEHMLCGKKSGVRLHCVFTSRPADSTVCLECERIDAGL